MEALLEKEGKVESWNDERLDELSRRMDSGFKEVRSEMRDGFARMDSRLDRLFYIQLLFMGSLAIGLLTDKI
ncbi:MAG TPA: hypothetical protein VFX35_12230 [Solirubrobacterales bacterium]|nr:hypothetical protein [Solirubrobacterales bacterium]